MNRCLECGTYIEDGIAFCDEECYELWDESFDYSLPPSKPVVLPDIDWEAIPF